MKNSELPAYPKSAYTDPLQGYGQCLTHAASHGLTKREHFAGQMLAARLTGLSMQKQDYLLSQVVHLAINDADELLKQLGE